jgi:hypothetical protein
VHQQIGGDVQVAPLKCCKTLVKSGLRHLLLRIGVASLFGHDHVLPK